MMQITRSAIIISFKDLMNSRSIDKITVKEICDRSYVNRHTFYYYFTDIMDIFKYIIFEELSKEIANNKTFETWETGFLATMDYLRRNSKMVLNIYHSSYWPEANVFLTDMSSRLVDGVVRECIVRMKTVLLQKDIIFITDFYSKVFNSFMLDWLSSGMKEEPNAVLKKLDVMTTDISLVVSYYSIHEEISHT